MESPSAKSNMRRLLDEKNEREAKRAEAAKAEGAVPGATVGKKDKLGESVSKLETALILYKFNESLTKRIQTAREMWKLRQHARDEGKNDPEFQETLRGIMRTSSLFDEKLLKQRDELARTRGDFYEPETVDAMVAMHDSMRIMLDAGNAAEDLLDEMKNRTPTPEDEAAVHRLMAELKRGSEGVSAAAEKAKTKKNEG